MSCIFNNKEHYRKICTFNWKTENINASFRIFLNFQSDQASLFFFASLGFSACAPLPYISKEKRDIFSVFSFYHNTTFSLTQAVILSMFSTWINLLFSYSIHVLYIIERNISGHWIIGSCYYSQLSYIKPLKKITFYNPLDYYF